MNAATVTRLGAFVLLALAFGHGCSIDDRVLSGEDLVGSEQCPDVGANACQTCLFSHCCDESLACGAGTGCSDLLGCSEACAGDSACVAQCRQTHARGLGAAGDLEGCGRSECATECAASTAPAAQGCSAQGSGLCENASDCAALNSGAWDDISTQACPACGALDGPGCAQCLSQQTGLSLGCSRCVADWLFCAALGCYQACGEGGNSSECSACVASTNQCSSQLTRCGFSG